MNIKSKIIMTLIAGLAIGFSGCSVKANYMTEVKTTSGENTRFIKADQDSTALGFIQLGNVTRTNYMYAFGAAATTTKENGFKYFTIISPKQIVQQYNDRNVKNLQDAYDACDTGKNSFKVGTSLLPADIHDNHCDHIVFDRIQATLAGTVHHGQVFFEILMHNDPRPESHSTFNAEEVLSDKLLSDLNKEYFTANAR